ncbi:MAG TPA: SDR family NAD(P)-dependent oxidoreductase, partial [Treponemataceae bacterium]|nr:SDR family NAD(P)-dependent oxidoreductase [Treponemataceae bacterium]
MKNKQLFHQKYGPLALVAGASEGLGAAFCEELAKQHFDLVLVARREEPLKELASRLSAEFGIEITTIIGDLADPETLKNILQVMQSLDVGLLVYNAAFSAIGEFASLPLSDIVQS